MATNYGLKKKKKLHLLSQSFPASGLGCGFVGACFQGIPRAANSTEVVGRISFLKSIELGSQ